MSYQGKFVYLAAALLQNDLLSRFTLEVFGHLLQLFFQKATDNESTDFYWHYWIDENVSFLLSLHKKQLLLWEVNTKLSLATNKSLY